MDMKGEQLIRATQDATWNALNNPEVLRECIPGCQSIERTSAQEFQVLMVARVGPVSAKFKGKLILSDISPPTSYVIGFEGQGGTAGYGKGEAKVRLAREGEGTRLFYEVNSTVGGKLAQIGSRLVDSAAKKIAEDFFDAFNKRVEQVPLPDDLTPLASNRRSLIVILSLTVAACVIALVWLAFSAPHP